MSFLVTLLTGGAEQNILLHTQKRILRCCALHLAQHLTYSLFRYAKSLQTFLQAGKYGSLKSAKNLRFAEVCRRTLCFASPCLTSPTKMQLSVAYWGFEQLAQNNYNLLNRKNIRGLSKL